MKEQCCKGKVWTALKPFKMDMQAFDDVSMIDQASYLQTGTFKFTNPALWQVIFIREHQLVGIVKDAAGNQIRGRTTLRFPTVVCCSLSAHLHNVLLTQSLDCFDFFAFGLLLPNKELRANITFSKLCVSRNFNMRVVIAPNLSEK